MLHRLLALIATATLCVAATAPPAVLAPYIHEGRFDPGDYGWMRGEFPDASAVARADMAAVDAWLVECGKQDLATTRAALATLGISQAKLESGAIRDPLCAAVASRPFLPAGTAYTAFAQALPRARAVADTYLFAVDMADKGTGGPDLATTLANRPIAEQALRRAASWGQGEAGTAPPLDPIALSIVTARIGAAMTERDHANTEWLKTVVAREGWPSLSTMGQAASQSAWLLVQHADADPAFQLRMLRLMEPLEAKHDLPRGNFAYLYDRVMLKLVGKQRYATQAMCRGGHRVSQPLEDEAAVAAWRRKAALDPLANYLAGMDRSFGPCPPDPVGKPASAQ